MTRAGGTWALDLDGTLLHLPVEIEAVRRGIIELFAGAGVSARPRPLLAGIARASQAAAHGDAAAQAAWLERGYAVIDAAELEAAPRATRCPGAETFVRSLGQAPVAIITNNGAAPARAAMDRLRIRPANLVALVGREPGAPTKPSPVPLLRALERRPEPLGEIIVVGDRPADMAMAAAARRALAARGGQVRAVGVRGRLEGEGELKAAGAEVVCQDLAEVLRVAGAGQEPKT